MYELEREKGKLEERGKGWVLGPVCPEFTARSVSWLRAQALLCN